MGKAKNEADQKALNSKEQIRNRHTEFRLSLSEYIETGLNKLANHFPGFQYETIYGHRGWGGAVARNDIDRGPDGRTGTFCLLYTSPSPRDRTRSRMPSSA